MTNRLKSLLGTVAVIVIASGSAVAIDANIRNVHDGHINRYNLSTDPQSGQLHLTATGCTLTTPTAATNIACATQNVADEVRGTVTATGGTTGTIVLTTPGLYRAAFHGCDLTTAQSAVTVLEVFEKVGTAGTAAALTDPVRWTTTTGSAGATHFPHVTASGEGQFSVSVSDAATAGGVIMTLTAKQDTGSPNIASCTFNIDKVTELSPPSPL